MAIWLHTPQQVRRRRTKSPISDSEWSNEMEKERTYHNVHLEFIKSPFCHILHGLDGDVFNSRLTLALMIKSPRTKLEQGFPGECYKAADVNPDKLMDPINDQSMIDSYQPKDLLRVIDSCLCDQVPDPRTAEDDLLNPQPPQNTN